MHQFLKFILGMKLYAFRTVPLSVVRSFSLYTQQWYMSYRFSDNLRAGSGRSVLILLASCCVHRCVWRSSAPVRQVARCGQQVGDGLWSVPVGSWTCVKYFRLIPSNGGGELKSATTTSLEAGIYQSVQWLSCWTDRRSVQNSELCPDRLWDLLSNGYSGWSVMLTCQMGSGVTADGTWGWPVTSSSSELRNEWIYTSTSLCILGGFARAIVPLPMCCVHR